MSQSGPSTVAVLALALAAQGTVADAQVAARAPSTISRDGCSYDACALRIEGKRIVRGRSGEVVLRLGPYTDVTHRVDWLSDSARAHAAMYKPRRSTAANLRLLAWGTNIASAVLGYQVYRDYKRQADEITAQQEAGGPVTTRIDLDQSKLLFSGALSVGGLVVRLIAGRIDEAARTQLARAVWWHNHEIRRD
jgi:hypothetical protein